MLLDILYIQNCTYKLVSIVHNLVHKRVVVNLKNILICSQMSFYRCLRVWYVLYSTCKHLKHIFLGSDDTMNYVINLKLCISPDRITRNENHFLSYSDYRSFKFIFIHFFISLFIALEAGSTMNIIFLYIISSIIIIQVFTVNKI